MQTYIPAEMVEEIATELDDANYPQEAADVRAALKTHQAGEPGPFRGWEAPLVWGEDVLDVAGLRWPREGDTPASYLERCEAVGYGPDRYQLMYLEWEAASANTQPDDAPNTSAQAGRGQQER